MKPTSENSTPTPNKYDRLATVYDPLAALYSGGGIQRAKNAHLSSVSPGQRVLYLGAGTAQEALFAVHKGARVTILDQSRSMIERARQRFPPAKEKEVTFLERNALEEIDEAPFDIVVAPFFLNVFSERDVGPTLHFLSRNVRHDGRFISVDFRAPAKRRALRVIQRAYYLPPLALFSTLANNPWHTLYDYPKIAAATAPDLILQDSIISRAYGMPLLETLIWRRK